MTDLSTRLTKLSEQNKPSRSLGGGEVSAASQGSTHEAHRGAAQAEHSSPAEGWPGPKGSQLSSQLSPRQNTAP